MAKWYTEGAGFHPGFKSRSGHSLDWLFLGRPEFNSSAMPVHSQLVCLPPPLVFSLGTFSSLFLSKCLFYLHGSTSLYDFNTYRVFTRL